MCSPMSGLDEFPAYGPAPLKQAAGERRRAAAVQMACEAHLCEEVRHLVHRLAADAGWLPRQEGYHSRR
jgi:hypothetical protein